MFVPVTFLVFSGPSEVSRHCQRELWKGIWLTTGDKASSRQFLDNSEEEERLWSFLKKDQSGVRTQIISSTLISQQK